MAQSKDISYRYANAWLDAAEERGVLSQIREEIDGLEALLNESEDLAAFMHDRFLPPQVKQDFLTKLFQGKIQDITLNFLHLLVSKQRERLFSEILMTCHTLLDERDGIINAEVASAVALSDGQNDMLQKKLASYTGKQIRMNTSVDTDLLGGFVVHIGDVVIDSSLRVQMQRVQQALTGR